VLVTRLESDLLDLLEATVDAQLADAHPRWSKQPAVCVVLASAGYPGPCQTGRAITGLDTIPPEVTVFHAGTRSENEHFLTSGGRVLGVTALGDDLQSARRRAYEAVEKIDFSGRHFRRDIAAKGVRA
jgi:phosphoribosylamine--glycine ligase